MSYLAKAQALLQEAKKVPTAKISDKEWNDYIHAYDLYYDCTQFTKLMRLRTGNQDKKLDMDFVIKMVNDEIQELLEAKDNVVAQVDAIIDAIYYVVQHLTKIEADPEFLLALYRNPYNTNVNRIRNLLGICSDEYVYIQQTYNWWYQLTTFNNPIETTPSLNIDYSEVRKNVDQWIAEIPTITEPLLLPIHLMKLVDILIRHLSNISYDDLFLIWKVVHLANMSKFEDGGGGYLREDGKWIKPKTVPEGPFVPPDEDIKRILFK